MMPIPLMSYLPALQSLALMFLVLITLPTRSETDQWISDNRKKQRLIITTVEVEPYYMAIGNRSRDYEGYIPDLLAELARRMHFDYYLRPARDAQYGQRRPDGSWTGVVGELLSNEADVAAAPLFITEQRARVVEFSEPFVRVQGTILIRRPLNGGKPYISSARGLINQSEIKYGTLNTGLLYWSFRNSNNSVYRIMARQMRNFDPPTLTSTNERGIERVRNEKYAFVLPSTIGEYVAERAPCDLITVDRFLMDRGYGLAAKKDSGLMATFSQHIRDLKREGFLDKLYHKWWFEKSDCRNGVVSSKLYFSASGSSRSQLALLLPVLVTVGVLSL